MIYNQKNNIINKQIDEIFNLAEVGILAEAKYFTDWDLIKDEIIELCFNDGELDSIVQDNDVGYYLETKNDGLKNKLIQKLGTDDSHTLFQYVIDNYDSDEIAHQIYYNILSDYYEMQKNELLREFAIDNNIYRRISFNGDIQTLISIIEKDGTGNCWAKNFNTSEAYYGGDEKYDYVFQGEATMENVDWKQTIYLRMVADYEDEIRLKRNAPIKVESIIIEEYNGSTFIGSTTYEYNKLLSVGSKYVY